MEHYNDLLRECAGNPCSPEEQAGQFWDEENRCDFRLVKINPTERKEREEAALTPDRDKILTWAKELNQRLLDMHPDLSSDEAKRIMFDAEKAIDRVMALVVIQAKEL